MTMENLIEQKMKELKKLLKCFNVTIVKSRRLQWKFFEQTIVFRNMYNLFRLIVKKSILRFSAKSISQTL